MVAVQPFAVILASDVQTPSHPGSKSEVPSRFVPPRGRRFGYREVDLEDIAAATIVFRVNEDLEMIVQGLTDVATQLVATMREGVES